MRLHVQLISLLTLALPLFANAQDTLRQYLSGHGKDDAIPWKFQCTSGANSGVWTNLPVPSQWDMHGFGTLNYKKDATNAWNERGLYEREFTVPNELRGKRIFLIFEGAMTDTSAKVNGQSVGPTHQGGFYRFKYEITKQVKFGETNLLEVEVAKHSANKSVNDAERLADYWVFGGIYRPVYLEAVPQEFIERVAIDAKASGDFAMDVFLNGSSDADSVEAQIMTLNGQPVGKAFSVSAPAGSDRAKTRLHTQVDSPQTWSAEIPNLYNIEVRLKHGTNTLHRFYQRFGFRTMEVREGDGLYVNGKRVILKGANRHSFWPESGRCLSTAVHKLDIETMKDMNMNAVRMSHYPPDQEFLDLCDQLGLYVLDELAGWHRHYDTEVGTKLVEEMVARDVNHPCILFWDNGNEGGFNFDLDPLFAKFDPQDRSVLHPWSGFSGINTSHYLAFDKAEVAAKGVLTYYHDGKEIIDTNNPATFIYMPTEFIHALYDGGAGAGLEDYWRMMSESKTLGGGFIWALIDEIVKRPDTGEMDAAGNQAPDGIVGPYREREASFYTIKELWSPIQVKRESSRTFTIQNQYSFLNTDQLTFTWELRKYPKLEEMDSEYETVAEENVEAPSIAPGSKGTLKVPLVRAEDRVDAWALRVDDPSGREIWTWVWPRPRTGDESRLVNSPAPQKAVGTETADAVEIKAGDLRVKISKQTGWLTEVSREDESFSLNQGPRLAMTNSAANSTLKSIRAEQDGPDYIVSAKFDGDLKSILWRVFGNGWVRCEYKYSATGTNDFLGVVFDYPEDYMKGKRWMGDGPARVWKNRLRGVTFGVWEDVYNNTITGYRDWEYPEFKGCFANVRWMQLDTTEGPISIVPEKIPFVQVLTPEQPPDKLIANTKVNLPECGLGLLHAIPAIGTKFKPATSSGPQSQPTVASGEYSGAVNFYFGDLPDDEEE
ncbi:MAG TPA: glycoside hydrolase family 2 TIM barrel-domain containing protein [Verrucomicrobiae bacterium]|nr:glycoside hydrolase family 2 TIM barrel-domain containing protein [Verrucomicrobiae bacterium]